ncbi:Uncharacterized protein HDE_04446 [Halotydeus destructor]|nr:Uncharacterized protein HDE_04446 [Halotydeus destructor]
MSTAEVAIITKNNESDIVDKSTQSEPVTFSPLTISTIAVQSGTTRIVVAFLQDSTQWPQLKIQEMSPSMADIGSNLDEATSLRRNLEDAINKLQTKQSPVEKVLCQADQVVSKAPRKSEVYSAMASNLANAWRGLNSQLGLRLQLLDQTVAFYSRCREFEARMDKCEHEFGITELPNQLEPCLIMIKKIVDMKKSILEASMFSMNEEQLLIEQLQAIKASNLADSRTNHVVPPINRTKNMVEEHLEALQERRRQLEILFCMRKAQLEKRLRLVTFNQELDRLRLWLLTTGAQFLDSSDLGESQNSVELILYQNKHTEKEANHIRDMTIKMAKRVDEVRCSDTRDKLFLFMDEVADFFVEFERRQELLKMAAQFYEKAHHSDNKLDQIEVTLKTWEPTNCETIENMSQALVEATEETLHCGSEILELAANIGTVNIERKMDQIEERRKNLDKLIGKAKRKSCEASELFLKKFEALLSWLKNFEEKHLELTNDMGLNLSTAKTFHDSHVKALSELQSKGTEVSAMFNSVPKMVNMTDQSDQIYEVSEQLRTGWQSNLSSVEDRVKLSKRYVAFHKTHRTLIKDMSDLEKKLNSSEPSDQLVKEATDTMVGINQDGYKLVNDGRNFIQEANDDSDLYLDKQSAIDCVEQILKEFEEKKSLLLDAIVGQQSKLASERQSKQNWENLVSKTKTLLDKCDGLDRKIFPLTIPEVDDVTTLRQHVLTSRANSVTAIKDLKNELEKCLDEHGAGCPKDKRSAQQVLVAALHRAIKRVTGLESDYNELVQNMVKCFDYIIEIKDVVDKQRNLVLNVPHLSLPEEVLNREYENTKYQVRNLDNQCSQLVEQTVKRIRDTEPKDIAYVDESKISKPLSDSKTNTETFFELYKEKIENYKKELLAVEAKKISMVSSEQQTEQFKQVANSSVQTQVEQPKIICINEKSIVSERKQFFVKEIQRVNTIKVVGGEQSKTPMKLSDIGIQTSIEKIESKNAETDSVLNPLSPTIRPFVKPGFLSLTKFDEPSFPEGGQTGKSTQFESFNKDGVQCTNFGESEQMFTEKNEPNVREKHAMSKTVLYSSRVTDLTEDHSDDSSFSELNAAHKVHEQRDRELKSTVNNQPIRTKLSPRASPPRPPSPPKIFNKPVFSNFVPINRTSISSERTTVAPPTRAPSVFKVSVSQQSRPASSSGPSVPGPARVFDGPTRFRSRSAHSQHLTPNASSSNQSRAHSRSPSTSSPVPSKFVAVKFDEDQPEAEFRVNPVWSPPGTRPKQLKYKPMATGLSPEPAKVIRDYGSLQWPVEAPNQSYGQLPRKSPVSSAVSPTSTVVSPFSLPSSPPPLRPPVTGRPPTFIKPLLDQKVTERSYVVMECTVDSYPAPVVTWFKDSKAVTPSSGHQVTALHGGICRLTIAEMAADKVGTYLCSASNQLGICNSTCKLQLVDKIRYAVKFNANQVKYH